MRQVLLHNARLVRAAGIFPGSVMVRDGHIALVLGAEEMPAGLEAGESIDLRGAYLAAGLIDIHIHGAVGVDVQATDDNGLTKLSEYLLSEGVTSYFATFVPTDNRNYLDAIDAIEAYAEQQTEAALKQKPLAGARIAGIHFEGPFVSEHRCGALRREHFRTYDGDVRSLDLFIKESSRGNRLMTLAPEIEGGIEITRELTRRGARVFIGHSQAQPATLDLALEAGACHITHFPNALDPLHHRKPGAVAWGLLNQSVTLDCIADFHHVHPMMLRLMYRSKGPDQMALISDAIMPAGLGDGEFLVWGESIAVREGRTSLARQPGQDTIAGSVISLRQALKNICSLDVPVDHAVRMGTVVPARAAGIEFERGSIEIGKQADLIAFDDEFDIKLAMVMGTPVLRG